MKVTSNAFLLCVGLLASAAAFADDAQIRVSCRGPLVEQDIVTHGTSASGKGQGTSPPFQVNVYANPGRGVVFLGVNDPIVCVAKINEGFRITGGRVNRDPNSAYTDWHGSSSSKANKPPPAFIVSHTSVSVGPPQTDSISFGMIVPDDRYTGTFGATFTVDYVAVN